MGRPPLGSRPGWPQSGFTLVEIMVVVVLIAITATFAVVNLQRDVDQVAELEARRFAQLIEQAREESILSGRPYAVEVDPDANSYRFLVHRSGWTPVEDDDVFRPRRFPSDLAVSFTTGGAPDAQDLLVIEGLGEISAFELSLRGSSRRYTVRLDEDQQVVVTETPDET